MRKIFYFIAIILIIWLAGCYWAINWIDKKTFSSFPGRHELALTRFFWEISPAINHEKDADRALKFSWLHASTEIYQNENKEISKITDILEKESLFVSRYIASNQGLISAKMKIISEIQLLTYLNRINLFINYFDQNIDIKMTGLDLKIQLLDPSIQENWYREMMIHGKLSGNINLYEANRGKLFSLLNRQQDIPNIFVEGMMNFYDGVLFCIAKQRDEALPYIKLAKNKLARYPEYAAILYSSDLNVILIGKGMKSDPSCKEAITDVISLGE